MTRYNHQLARHSEQADRMKSLEQRGVCAFCRDNIKSETTSKVAIETKHWLVKDNDYPYKNTKCHLLIIPKEHVLTVSELSIPAQSEFLKLISRIEKDYELSSFAVALRSGNMIYNGGTVEHIHAHVIVGDTDDKNHEPVRFKMSSRPKD